MHLCPFEAGAAPRGGLGWTCPPHFFEDNFSNWSKFDEKRLRGGGSFLASQGSVLVSLRLQFSDQSLSFALCSLQPTIWDFIP